MKTISRLSKMTKHSILKRHTVNDMLLVITKKINKQTDKQSNKNFTKNALLHSNNATNPIAHPRYTG